MTNWRWPHFKPSELACRCCGELPESLDEQLLDRLEMLRLAMNAPLRVTSGHRCRTRNLQVGGKAYSQHKSLAVDVSLAKHDHLKMYTNAILLGFRGIGLDESFIHLDMRNKIDGYQPSRKLTVWFYSKKGKEKWTQLLAEVSSDSSGV